VRFLRFFEKFHFFGSNISIANAALLEVLRMQKGVRQNENSICTFISGHFSDSKLDFKERLTNNNNNECFQSIFCEILENAIEK